ncbi:siderophore iron transporter-like protein [Elsinoe ampelina]|uniref:Siderophore iron transporter-like protein n=1 Tax=Elsinoe ampelina TaxID=302913 RepID=A0A6A6G941_9PEZI|nr:siderophore iron transporter-like protein [Elsinoe ampelina]
MRLRIPGFAPVASGVDDPTKDSTSPRAGTSTSSDIERRGEKDAVVNGMDAASDSHSDADSIDEKIDVDAQYGTQAVQAMTHVWTKRDLVLAYLMIWLIEFTMAFASGIINTLTPYVTSSFQEHSLTALTGVISSLIAGIFKLPYAKIMDIWGRPQALCLMVASITLGTIMMAGCNNVATYCAAQVFYWLGYNGIDFTLIVFIADTSQLRNRGLWIAFASSPYLITTWVYGYAANDIIYGVVGLRWGFGIFAIVLPVVCAPFLVLLFVNQRKAEKMGLIQARVPRSLLDLAKEFDVVGILILATGLSLFLLAFNIYSYQADGWKSPLIICFIIFGALLIIGFAVWEKLFAPVTFIPWHLITNRTVVFTYVMAASLYTGWYVWDSYFYSLNIVLFNQSVVHATYIGNIYTIGSCFICIVYGLLLRFVSGRLKLYSLFWGVPLTMLGVGLMIKFRQPDVNIGYIVMCQIFIAFGGGVLVISEQTTLMAVSKQRDFPALLAMESMIISIGSAIGSTIAGAMWTGIFPAKLAINLPAEAQANLTTIYGDMTVQSSYEWGSPTRDAINLSYGETQRYMLIAATCIYSITIVSVALWQDVDLRKQKQRKIGLF